MPTRTISNAGGNWSATTAWVEGAVPTAADEVVATGTSGNLTINTSTRVCRSLNLAGYVGTLTQSASLNIGDGTAGTGNIALNLPSGMTFTHTTGTITLVSTSATQQSVNVEVQMDAPLTFNGAAGSWILTHDLDIVTQILTVTTGSFDSGNFDIACGRLSWPGSSTKSITLGTSNITIPFAASMVSAGATGTTFSGASSTINLTASGLSGGAAFTTGGLAWGTINVDSNSGGTSTCNFNGGGSFVAINRATVGSKTITFDNGATTTVGALPSGTSGNKWSIQSDSLGSACTVDKLGGGNFSIDYVNMRDVTGPAGTNYAGANSTNTSGNTNWTFTAPPSGTTVTPTTLALVISTFAPIVSTPRLTTPTTLALVTNTFAPTVTVSNPVTVTPSTLSVIIAAFAPIVSTPRLVTPATVSLTYTGLAPTVSTPILVTPTTGSLTLTTFAPGIQLPILVTPDTKGLVITTFDSLVSTPVVITPSTVNLVYTGLQAVVSTPILVTPATVGLVITTFASSVQLPLVSVPDTINLVTNHFAPIVGLGYRLVPGTLSLSLTGYAPEVSTYIPDIAPMEFFIDSSALLDLSIESTASLEFSVDSTAEITLIVGGE